MHFSKQTIGFTLIELMVAIAIFATISLMAFANIRQGAPGQEVQLQANNASSLFRQAQVQALSGEPFNGTVPVGGYGVSFTVPCSSPPCTMSLFADLNNSFSFDSPSELVEEISLGPNVNIISSTLGNGNHDVLFKPPRPFMCFDGQCDGLGERTITLGSDASSRQSTITLNQVSGQIGS